MRILERTRSSVYVAVAATALTLTACSPSEPQILEGPEFSALTYERSGNNWEVLNVGRLVVLGDGCLGVERLETALPEDAGPFVVALPTGSAVSGEGEISLDGAATVSLGETFTFSQEPFDGAVADLPSAEIPVFSAVPEGCPPEIEVVVLLPIEQ